MIDGGSKTAQWVFNHRGVMANLPLFFALFWFRGATNAPLLTWPLGVALILVGLAMRIWAQSHIHHRLKVPLQFVSSGPYRLVRNPLYIGNTFICVGATVLSKLLWLAPVTLLWCAAVLSVVVGYEENKLSIQYGKPYRDYLTRVPRWFPHLRIPEKLELLNEYSGRAVRAELHCLLIIIPFLLKALAAPLAWHRLWSVLFARF